MVLRLHTSVFNCRIELDRPAPLSTTAQLSRQANVAVVFKKGEKYNAANYRPVSLTCICCKTLEHIIVSNINKHLAFESILADCQIV